MKAAAVGFLVLHLVLGWSLRTPGVTLISDDASYLVLGRELGHLAYRTAWTVGAPPHGQYPPGYPALLAVSGAAAPGHAGTGVVLNLLLSTAALGVFTLLCWRWSPAATLGALGAAAVNPTMLRYAGSLMSEPLFMFLLFLGLWCAVSRPSRWYLAATVAIAAALTRSIGLAVIAGLLVDWMGTRRWRPALGLGLAAALTVGLWFVRAAMVPQQLAGQSYIGDALHRSAPEDAPETTPSVDAPPAPAPVAPSGAVRVVQGLARRVAVNGARYASNTLPSMLRVPTSSTTIVDNIVWVFALAGLGIAGMVVRGRPRAVASVVLAGYLGILLVWPYVLWRFLVPVLPLILFFVLDGARRVLGRVPRVPEWIPVAAFAGVLMVAGFRGTVRELRLTAGCDREHPFQAEGCFTREQVAFVKTVEDANRSAPAGAVFLTPKPSLVFYLTGHTAVDDLFATGLDPDQLDGFLRRNGVSFAVLGRVHARFNPIIAGLRARCEDWTVAIDRADDGAALLQRRGRADTSAPACGVLRRLDGSSP